MKPVFSTLTEYIPGGKEGKAYSPASLVATVRVAFVPELTTVTAAPATMAPLESRVSPLIDPKVWLKPNWVANNKHAKTNSRVCIT